MPQNIVLFFSLVSLAFGALPNVYNPYPGCNINMYTSMTVTVGGAIGTYDIYLQTPPSTSVLTGHITTTSTAVQFFQLSPVYGVLPGPAQFRICDSGSTTSCTPNVVINVSTRAQLYGSNTCVVDLSSNAYNCGSYGNVCTGQCLTGTCSGGSCVTLPNGSACTGGTNGSCQAGVCT